MSALLLFLCIGIAVAVPVLKSDRQIRDVSKDLNNVEKEFVEDSDSCEQSAVNVHQQDANAGLNHYLNCLQRKVNELNPDPEDGEVQTVLSRILSDPLFRNDVDVFKRRIVRSLRRREIPAIDDNFIAMLLKHPEAIQVMMDYIDRQQNGEATTSHPMPPPPPPPRPPPLLRSRHRRPPPPRRHGRPTKPLPVMKKPPPPTTKKPRPPPQRPQANSRPQANMNHLLLLKRPPGTYDHSEIGGQYPSDNPMLNGDADMEFFGPGDFVPEQQFQLPAAELRMQLRYATLGQLSRKSDEQLLNLEPIPR